MSGKIHSCPLCGEEGLPERCPCYQPDKILREDEVNPYANTNRDTPKEGLGMTHGDDIRIKCPTCKVGITNPIEGHVPQRGDIAEFDKPCPYCGTPLHFWARWSIAVDAEKESKVR